MPETPLIEITNLSLRLNNTDLLDSISMSSKDYGVTMVMGPNGAGKSLLLKMSTRPHQANLWVH